MPGLINSKGTCVCVSCGQPGAEVGRTKGGAPYVHCDSEECEGTKFWTHGSKSNPIIKGKARKVLIALRAGQPAAGVDVEAWAKEIGVELPAAAPAKPQNPEQGSAPKKSLFVL